MSSETQEDRRRDELIVETILALHPVVYVNYAKTPVILLPLTVPLNERRPVPLESKRCKSELAKIAWNSLHFLCHIQESQRVVQFLIGMGWEDVRINAEFAELLDDDPLVEALSILLLDSRYREKYQSTCSVLLKRLLAIAENDALDTTSRLWPKNASQLSRRLSDLSEVILNLLGYSIDRNRGPTGSRIMVIRKQAYADDGDSAPNRRQVIKGISANSLASADGDDGKSGMQKLFDQIDSKRKK